MLSNTKYYFFRFLHNGICHGLFMSMYEPNWAHRFHDWTYKKMEAKENGTVWKSS